MIKVDGLTKRYARTIAVDNISFEVEKGQLVGWEGKNAPATKQKAAPAGKSKAAPAKPAAKGTK